jgi:hypothetical protein
MKLRKYDLVESVNLNAPSNGLKGYVVDILDDVSVEVLFPRELGREDCIEIFTDFTESDLKVILKAPDVDYSLWDDVDSRYAEVRTKQSLEYSRESIKKNTEKQTREDALKHYINLLVDKTLEEEYEDFKNFFIGIHDMEASFNTEEIEEITPESHPYLLAQEIDRLSHGGEVILIRTNEELTDVPCKSFQDIVNFYKEDLGV